MNKGNYEDCLKFIENELHIRLLDFQKEVIKGYFENRIVRTGRGTGCTMCREAYGKYINSLNDNSSTDGYTSLQCVIDELTEEDIKEYMESTTKKMIVNYVEKYYET